MAIPSRDVQPFPSPEELLFGWHLYPASPLSWLAPLWAYVCGAAASGAWSWSGGSLLRLLLGLLLAGPMLALAWASVQHLAGNGPEVRRLNPMFAKEKLGASGAAADDGAADACLGADPRGEHAAGSTASLPYTLRGSASDRITRRLSRVVESWKRMPTQLRRSLVALAASTLFAFAVAAHLGASTAALTAMAFGLLYGVALLRSRWARSIALSTALPLLAAWLLGHATYALPSVGSAATGAAFAAALASARIRARGATRAFWQALAQLIAGGVLVTARQPIAASVVALLAFPALLLAPLLNAPESRQRYFAAQQSAFVVSMLVAGLALGYRP